MPQNSPEDSPYLRRGGFDFLKDKWAHDAYAKNVAMGAGSASALMGAGEHAPGFQQMVQEINMGRASSLVAKELVEGITNTFYPQAILLNLTQLYKKYAEESSLYLYNPRNKNEKVAFDWRKGDKYKDKQDWFVGDNKNPFDFGTIDVNLLPEKYKGDAPTGKFKLKHLTKNYLEGILRDVVDFHMQNSISHPFFDSITMGPKILCQFLDLRWGDVFRNKFQIEDSSNGKPNHSLRGNLEAPSFEFFVKDVNDKNDPIIPQLRLEAASVSGFVIQIEVKNLHINEAEALSHEVNSALLSQVAGDIQSRGGKPVNPVTSLKYRAGDGAGFVTDFYVTSGDNARAVVKSGSQILEKHFGVSLKDKEIPDNNIYQDNLEEAIRDFKQKGLSKSN